MKHGGVKVLVLACAILSVIGLAAPSAASAHKQLTAGPSGVYAIEMGFNQEPALQGNLNGLYLSVRNSRLSMPVTGLGSTLKAEIAFGDAKRTLTLEPQEGQDGVYIAWVVPTDVGPYTWRVFGSIQGNTVDLSATSGPDSFNEVQPQSDLSFPGTGSAAGTAGGSADVSKQLIALRDEADSAASAASTARWIALVAVVLGIVGVVLGGIVVRRR
jgi:hypothetical protein